MTTGSIPRYARTLRHLKVSQILWRARYAVEKRLPISKTPSFRLPSAFDPETAGRLHATMNELAWILPPSDAVVDALCRNEFTFLNHTEHFDAPVDWTVPNVSALWRYHLHYFGWGRTLAIACLRDNREDARAQFLRLVEDWIERNPRGSSPAWDAFVVSSRLMNWAQAFSVIGEVSSPVIESFVSQTDWLLHHLEKDVLANHLLKNAQALVLAGAVLGNECGRAATRCGKELLDQELDEQILEDGGHYERSLMYHCQILEDNLLVHAALENPPAKLATAIEKMTGFLARMIYRDDGIPQFGDASLDLEFPADALLQFAKKRIPNIDTTRPTGRRAEKASGFYILESEDGEARMTVKAGEPGPAYQLGHAHCDMLSYEFTVGTRRVIVDSGVFGYEDDTRRAYCRSSAAHNTVQVNRREQMECWDRFRVGRRYKPMLNPQTNHLEGRVRASHDGFRPYCHERSIVLTHQAIWLVTDTITGQEESCDLESYMHFHPGVIVIESENAWKATAHDATVFVVPFGFDRVESFHGSEEPLRGWYFPSFGEALPATCLRMVRRATAPVLCGYGIFVGSDARPAAELLPLLIARLQEIEA